LLEGIKSFKIHLFSATKLIVNNKKELIFESSTKKKRILKIIISKRATLIGDLGEKYAL
tara:strand:- start:646 stop:822 length:177 start_codon:yes stop_codon:yes gene_type:complete